MAWLQRRFLWQDRLWAKLANRPSGTSGRDIVIEFLGGLGPIDAEGQARIIHSKGCDGAIRRISARDLPAIGT